MLEKTINSYINCNDNEVQSTIISQCSDAKTEYFEVSVIVCCYNPKYEALEFTLNSIISQKNIRLEIIIADDGSKNNLKYEIEEYFIKNGFKDWRMICNDINHGTVHNVQSGLLSSKGRFAKVISPGDALNGDYILREWIDFNESNGYRWSFSNAIYYTVVCNKRLIVQAQAHPNNVKPYIQKKEDICRWNYIVLDDIALGAALIGEKNLQLDYINRIINKVVYAEDNIWRMMMFDGIIGGFFPKDAVIYEFGTGISTESSNKWDSILKQDWNATDNILKEYGLFDKFQNNIIRAWELKNSNNLTKCLIRGKVLDFFKRKVIPRKTSLSINKP